ncbi:unnamed protein product [Diamesa serratosioi]
MTSMKSLITIVLAIFLLFSLAQNVEAGYKKPPFNGSMFGKRGTSTDYDPSTKNLNTLCEVATDACQLLFTQDK